MYCILGTGHGYHALTIGLYMDQLVRLVDPKHRAIAQFFQEEVAQPFGKHTHTMPTPSCCFMCLTSGSLYTTNTILL